MILGPASEMLVPRAPEAGTLVHHLQPKVEQARIVIRGRRPGDPKATCFAAHEIVDLQLVPHRQHLRGAHECAMAIDAELLEVLVCPETHQPVKLADEALVQDINGRAKAGTLKNRSGNAVSGPIEAALVREDGKCAYLIEGDIPNMLIDERIEL